MINKNKSGIDNFLTSQKLFQRDKPTYSHLGTGQKGSDYMSSSRNNTSRSYHYHLLNDSTKQKKIQTNLTPETKDKDLKKEQSKNIHSSDIRLDKKSEVDSIKEEQKNNEPSVLTQRNSPQTKINSTSHQQKTPIKRARESNSNPLMTKRQVLVREASFVGQIPVQQQSQKSTLQGIMIKSSNKYFDSCRIDALNFLQKMQDMLLKDSDFVYSSLQKIKVCIEDCHLTISQKIKQYMYRIIDESIDNWRLSSLQKFSKSEIDYAGELLQLSTQIEQRQKQIALYRVDLQDDRHWKNRASDLLTSNYQADILELSKLCQKAVDYSFENIVFQLDVLNNNVEQKLNDRDYSNFLIQKMNMLLLLEKDQNAETGINTSRQPSVKKISPQNTLKSIQFPSQKSFHSVSHKGSPPSEKPSNLLHPPIQMPNKYKNTQVIFVREPICPSCSRMFVSAEACSNPYEFSGNFLRNIPDQNQIKRSATQDDEINEDQVIRITRNSAKNKYT